MFVVFSSYFLFSIPTVKVTIDDGSLLFEAAQHPSGHQAFEAWMLHLYGFLSFIFAPNIMKSMETYWKVMKCCWIFGEGPTILDDRKGGFVPNFLNHQPQPIAARSLSCSWSNMGWIRRKLIATTRRRCFTPQSLGTANCNLPNIF